MLKFPTTSHTHAKPEEKENSVAAPPRISSVLSEKLFIELLGAHLLVGEKGDTRSCKDHTYDDEQYPKEDKRVPPSTVDQRCACCETWEEGERGTDERYSSCNDEKEPNQATSHHGIAGSTRESGGNVMLGHEKSFLPG